MERYSALVAGFAVIAAIVAAVFWFAIRKEE